MRSWFSVNRLSTVVAVLAASISSGCGSPRGDDETGAGAVEPGSVALAEACLVAAPEGVSSLAASDRGVVFAVTTEGASGPEVLLQRTHGEGCHLSADGQAPIAAEALLDADDAGNVYAFPASAGDPAIVSTMLPEFPEIGSGMVVKVDPGGNVSERVSAWRGIWSFGVSPEGGTFQVTACGPTGIFAMAGSGLHVAIPPPQTLWEQMPAVLSNDRTLWSVGFRTCGVSEAVTPACGYALVRTTPEGSQDVGSTVVDFGAGFEQGTLARCGANVCGLFASGVAVWDPEGNVLRTFTASDVSARLGERITQVSGNHHGLYLLLRSEAGTRVVFVPVAVPHAGG